MKLSVIVPVSIEPDRGTFAATIGLFALGVAANLYFGRRGFLPLDQSIVFDGGWRVLSGQVPFRDFVAPGAITPSVMQAPFFALLGVTWFALVFHASVINGLACAATYAFLRLCGATRFEATLFGALTAFFFYPPTGTPFTDQHAFFFTLLMLLAVVAGTVARGRPGWIAWFAVPLLFALAYFSCQIPTSFAALCIVVWVAANWAGAWRWVSAMTAGTLALGLLLAILAWTYHVDLRTVWTYVVTMPLGTGADRTPALSALSPVRLILGTYRRLPGWAGLWSIDLAVVTPFVLLAAARVRPFPRLLFWSSASVLFVTIGFVAYSNTPLPAGLGLTMLMAGLSTVALRETAEAVAGNVARRRAAAVLVPAVIAVAAILDTAAFVRTTDVPRMPHAAYDAAADRRARGHLPAALSFMGWSRGASHYEPGEMAALVTYLRDADGNFLLIGDSSVLYGLTGKPSVSPALWLDPGLSMPRVGTAEFARFEAEILSRIRVYHVHRIVLEGPRTWTHTTLDDFPNLKRMTESRACGERHFGDVRVIEMCLPS